MTRQSQIPKTGSGYATWTELVLSLARVAVGWHFLYEGLIKVADKHWSAGSYLALSTGPLAGIYGWVAAHATVLKVVDQLNIWGMILIGACLILGLLTRVAAVGGFAMLVLYVLAYPSMPWAPPVPGSEGHYLGVDKNLIEALLLCIVAIVGAGRFGLDAALRRARKRVVTAGAAGTYEAEPQMILSSPSRRHVLTGLLGLPFAGAFALAWWRRHSFEERLLAARSNTSGGLEEADAVTGATIKPNPELLGSGGRLAATSLGPVDVSKLTGTLPKAKIGNVSLSRMILGGNLIGGWAHARDLIYVSSLVQAYHTRAKVFQTLQIAEACGVNTLLTNPVLCDLINDYWKSTGGKMQFISDCGFGDPVDMVKKSVDNGACACYIQGGTGDQMVRRGQFDHIQQALDLCRQNGLPAGMGAHRLETIKGCVEHGIKPDFWMKTLHRDTYGSAYGPNLRDNNWCESAPETIEYMKALPQPWIAYKILAAGALRPRQQFRWAFESGADFICVGMYDFQIVEDVNIAAEVFASSIQRERPWYA